MENGRQEQGLIEGEGLENSNFPPKPEIGGEGPSEMGKGVGPSLTPAEGEEQDSEESQADGESGPHPTSEDTSASLHIVEEGSSETSLPDAQPFLKRTVSELSSPEVAKASEKRGRIEVGTATSPVEMPSTCSTTDQCSFLNIALQSTPLEKWGDRAFRRSETLDSPPNCYET